MKTQTKEEMIELGASEEEAEAALKLFALLRPSLQVSRENGRIEIQGGNKTVLGLYRTVKDLIKENL